MRQFRIVWIDFTISGFYSRVWLNRQHSSRVKRKYNLALGTVPSSVVSVLDTVDVSLAAYNFQLWQVSLSFSGKRC